MVKTKSKKRLLSPDEKLYKALQALFILQAIQLKMGNADMQKILGVDKADVNSVAKLVNKALKKARKGVKL